jgi:hypothetical protein
MQKKKKIRISLDLSQAAFERLAVLESMTDVDSKADVIRDALRMYEYLVRQAVKGCKIQCVSPTGEITEVFATSLPTAVSEDALAPV